MMGCSVVFFSVASAAGGSSVAWLEGKNRKKTPLTKASVTINEAINSTGLRFIMRPSGGLV